MAFEWTSVPLMLLVLMAGSAITCAFGDIWSDITEHKFPVRVEIPSTLLDHVSPLDTESAVAYCAKIEDGSITQFSKSFCLEAKMLCHDGDMEIPYPPQHEEVVDHLTSGESGQSGKLVAEDMFHPLTHSTSFSAKDLAAGNDIHFPVDSIRDLFPTMSFLPQNLSMLLPFSSAKLPDLLAKLNIPDTSKLAAMMAATLAQCEAKSPEAHVQPATASPTCVTSLEEMISYVADGFPQDARIYLLNRTILPDITPLNGPAAAKGPSNGGSFKVLETQTFDLSIICHKSMFPYAVFKCDNVDAEGTIKTYAVAMESQADGSHMHQVASCRINKDSEVDIMTRKFDPESNYNNAGACHWITDAFVWVPATTT